jgi:hypothetical protein
MNLMVRPAQIDRSMPVEALAGTVERVTFHNAENGFCVLKVQARGKRDLVTVVGHAPAIGAGEWITATGVWVKPKGLHSTIANRSHRALADAYVTAFILRELLQVARGEDLIHGHRSQCSCLGLPSDDIAGACGRRLLRTTSAGSWIGPTWARRSSSLQPTTGRRIIEPLPQFADLSAGVRGPSLPA